jgi:WD domain, G-beta repeat
VLAVAFAPDGRTLATGSLDMTAILWDLADRAHPRRLGEPFTNSDGGVASVAFAPDGRTLATGNEAGTTILWDLAELDSLRDQAAKHACSLTQRGLAAPDEGPVQRDEVGRLGTLGSPLLELGSEAHKRTRALQQVLFVPASGRIGHDRGGGGRDDRHPAGQTGVLGCSRDHTEERCEQAEHEPC